jgi:hypothetical protein
LETASDYHGRQAILILRSEHHQLLLGTFIRPSGLRFFLTRASILIIVL